MKQEFKFNFRDRNLAFEIGQMAKQTDASVVTRYGDTVVLSTVVHSREPIDRDFFPLMVIYQEKLYAAGKIPGGFIKREGRPTDNATLASRLIDRPIRPLWPKGFYYDVQVVNTVLSVDQDNAPEMAAMLGSSLALKLAGLPFDGPIAGVIVGRVNGELVINPTVLEAEVSDLDLTVAGNIEAINMVEAAAKEVSEDDMVEAIMFGHEAVQELIGFQNEVIEQIKPEPFTYQLFETTEELFGIISDMIETKMVSAIAIKDKTLRNNALDVLHNAVNEYLQTKYIDAELSLKQKEAAIIFEKIEKKIVRKMINEEGIRPDGRKATDIRSLDSQIDLLPRTHGSALFTRGQTQALSITTLGALNEYQILDGLSAEDSKRFILHYNFPPFSVGETGRYGAPGRREIGHGALGERALAQVIPGEEKFPYTIRLVSEILESSGSTSQASICAGCLSLMAAGVPIKAPVAGIAMGLIKEGDKFTVLSDIQDIEDFMGDMDFKVAGTKEGICALQMDIKISGITREIFTTALNQAKIGRLHILDNMLACISEPRSELSKYAPKIEMFMIKPEKIKDVIGRGGEMITKIILEASNVTAVNDIKAVKVDLEDDGRVIIYHSDQDIIAKTRAMIEEVVKEVVIGTIYEVKVVKIEEFGAFVELWPGMEGLVHISQLEEGRVEKTSDVVAVGDKILVKATGYDKRGKLNLSRKEAMVKKQNNEANNVKEA